MRVPAPWGPIPNLLPGVACAFLTSAGTANADATARPWPTEGWETISPERVGLDPEPLRQLASDARMGRFPDLHSLLIVKDGWLAFEEYLPGGARDQLHTVQSVTKSVTATLVGIAIEQGFIPDTNGALLDFFPQYDILQNLDDRKRAITLEHVLRMRLGLAWREHGTPYEDPENSLHQLNEYDGDWYELVLDTPMAHAPGERYVYNSGGAILLAGVLEHATGSRADLFAREHLFEPLGIRAHDWTVIDGVPHTGGGLSLASRDMAKIGYLYLNDGVWEGKRLLPEGWVTRATTSRIESPQAGAMPIGYGYMWWLLPGPADVEREAADAAIYAAWGYMGQFVFLAPAYDLVFVTTGGATDFADETKPFDLLYDYVLPAADPSLTFEPLPDSSATDVDNEAADGDPAAAPIFEVTMGGANADRGIAVVPTRDGGYVVTGTTRSESAGGEDVYLVRADAEGNVLFTRNIGGAADDAGWSVHETTDGFFVAGFTESSGAGGVDGYLVRTDANGDTRWTRTYGGSGDDYFWSALPLGDGDLLLAGQTASRGAGEADFYLVRCNGDGEVLWERTYGGTAVDRAFSVQPAGDGGYLLAGITYSFGAGGRDGYVVATDADGNERWSRALGSDGYDVVHAVCKTSAPGCLLLGYSSGLGGSGGEDGWVVKLTPDGETEWSSHFGGARDERILNGVELAIGGYAVTGFTASTEGRGLDAYLVCLDEDGEVLRRRTFGGHGEDSGYGIAATPDGGVIVTGLTRSRGEGESDLYLIKIGGAGLQSHAVEQ